VLGGRCIVAPFWHMYTYIITSLVTNRILYRYTMLPPPPSPIDYVNARVNLSIAPIDIPRYLGMNHPLLYTSSGPIFGIS